MVVIEFVKVLKCCAVLDGVVGVCYLLLVTILRICTVAAGGLPNWVRQLNDDFKQDMTNTSGTGFLFVLLYALCFVIPKVCAGIFLWKCADRKNKRVLPKWTVGTTMLCIIGFLLLIPISRHDVYEYGISFIFTIVTTLVSFPTIIVAAAYFLTYAFDETELINC